MTREFTRENLIKAMRECLIENETDWNDPEICDQDDPEMLGLYLGEQNALLMIGHKFGISCGKGSMHDINMDEIVKDET